MSHLSFEATSIEGLHSITRQKMGDNRGYLSRLFCPVELKSIGWNDHIQQINYTKTEIKGTIRGMHYQASPHCETKIVSCMKGVIFDVAVDLRKDSPTYLKWESMTLSEDNLKSFYIPKGIAHGFQTLSDNCEILYLHSELYKPQSDVGVNALDPKIDINWPIPVSLMSERDRNHPMI